MYRVFISRSAERQLKKLPLHLQRRVAAVISALEIDPRPIGSKKLSGTDHSHRIRVGDYRVIYDVIDCDVTVTVLKLGHRRDVYR